MALHREPLGRAMAAEEYGARFFSNGAEPRGVLKSKSRLSEQALANLKESWAAAHQGLTQAHRIAILEEGVEWTQIAGNPQNTQLNETRQFQLTEISRIFRVPPHKISALNRATYSNIDKQALEFVVDSLRPWLVRWEQQIHLSLMTPAERRLFYAEHEMNALLRGTPRERADFYAKGKQWGWFSTNDIRELENLDPVDGGDDYWMPVNMVPIGQERAPVAPTPNGNGAVPARANGAVRKRIERDGAGRIMALIEERAP